MSFDSATPLIAVDIGNTRIKLGLFDQPPTDRALPMPSRVLDLPAQAWDPARVVAWLPPKQLWPQWRVASVNRPAAAHWVQWLERHVTTPAGTPVVANILTSRDFPIAVEVEHPDRVGADRLSAAAAANRLRQSDRAAIVIDFGSAVTVDLVSADGKFCGGAILPGIDLSARALHEFTDLLPLVTLSDLTNPPSALGNSTVTAIRGGLFWSVVGAVRELTAQLSSRLSPSPEVFLTGGAAAHFATVLDLKARYEPHLVLSGIALGERGA